MIRELANSDAAYRSITESWFRHSGAIEIFRRLAELGYKVILTTDHGTIRVDNPIKVVGDRNTNTNLRYKVGKNLNYNPKQVYEIHNPKKYGLPAPNLSSIYIFATNEDFFSYPNNYKLLCTVLHPEHSSTAAFHSRRCLSSGDTHSERVLTGWEDKEKNIRSAPDAGTARHADGIVHESGSAALVRGIRETG